MNKKEHSLGCGNACGNSHYLRYKRCGYPLQRRTDKPCDRRKFGAGNGDARDCNFRKQSGIIPERTGAKWQV